MIPWTVAYQAPLSMEFSRQEYWSALPFPSPGIFPIQGSNPGLPHYRQTLYHLSYQGSPNSMLLLGSSPSRIQGNPQDEQHQWMRERVRQSSGLSLKFIFAWPLYTLNNISFGEVHIAYTQGISKHYSNLTFNRNRMSPTYFLSRVFYYLAFKPVNILWLAPGVT